LAYWINTTSGVFQDAQESHFKVGDQPVDITFHPNGKWAYVVNYEDATINTFSINNLNGGFEKKLQTLKTDKAPVNLQIEASGRFAYLVYRESNQVSLYSVDSTTGRLKHQNDVRNDGVITDVVIDAAIH
jgi:6-phosphogluconolactonase